MELCIDRLTKQYGHKLAVDRVDLELHQGVYGLLGANGAGKTTLMRMLCDILTPTSGEIRYNGQEIGALGEKFDFLIGACDSRQWLDRCNFLPLGEYRHCIAVPRGHPLAGRKGLTLAELHGETLMMVKQGDSPSVDRVRAAVEAHPQIHIEDTPQFYDMEVFNRSVQTGHLLMSLDCWTEVHPSLVTLPVDWNFTIPYGLLYQLRPGADVARFVALVRGDGPA